MIAGVRWVARVETAVTLNQLGNRMAITGNGTAKVRTVAAISHWGGLHRSEEWLDLPVGIGSANRWDRG